MKNSKIQEVVLTAMILGLIGCGKSGGGQQHAGQSAQLSSALQGSWKSECLVDSTYEISAIMALSFKGSQFIGELQTSDDKSCGKNGQKWKFAGTYKLGKSLSDPAGATEIDYLLSNVITTIEGQEYIDWANSEKYCGLSNWKANEPRDVTGTECDNDMWISQSRFSIIKTDGNKLFIGGVKESRNSGSAADARLEKLMPEPLLRR